MDIRRIIPDQGSGRSTVDGRSSADAWAFATGHESPTSPPPAALEALAYSVGGAAVLETDATATQAALALKQEEQRAADDKRARTVAWAAETAAADRAEAANMTRAAEVTAEAAAADRAAAEAATANLAAAKVVADEATAA